MATNKPQIISNSQPHTVSLPAGSTVAARKVPRKPPPAPEVPQVETPDAAPRPAPAAPKPAAKAPAKPTPRAEKRKAAAPVAPPPAPVEQVGFGADIMQRLQGLRQRNDEVRAALDQLPAAAGAKR